VVFSRLRCCQQVHQYVARRTNTPTDLQQLTVVLAVWAAQTARRTLLFVSLALTMLLGSCFWVSRPDEYYAKFESITFPELLSVLRTCRSFPVAMIHATVKIPRRISVQPGHDEIHEIICAWRGYWRLTDAGDGHVLKTERSSGT